MKFHHSTTRRPRRSPDATAPQHYTAPAPTPDLLRQPGAARREEAVATMQRAVGNAAVERALAQRDPAAQPAAPAAQAAPAVSAEALAEFERLKSKITDGSAADYVKHRDTFFGSPAAYQAYAAVADKELEGTKGLRRRIELGSDPEAQRVFYRWVRKAYENAGITDVPALILKGSSEKLKGALAAVKEGYGEAFKSGGFNPRPKKSAKYRYRLGTISEHALGNAVDVESASNPILSPGDWKYIEGIAGKSVDRRLARWKSEPETLWQDVHELNELFVANVAQELERVASEQKEATANTDAAKKVKKKRKQAQPIDVVFSGHKSLKKWAGGFFTLDWALVQQFHAQNFTWGLTFSNGADLHHFELSEH